MVASSQVVNAYASAHGARAPGPLGLRGGVAAARRPRLRHARRRPPTPASSPTRTSAWPTSSSPTAPGSTSTTPTRSTPRPRSPPRSTWCAGTRPASRSCSTRRGGPASGPGGAPIVLYKNNTDNKGASYGAHENYLMRRSTPFARHRAAPDAVLRQPAGRLPAPAGSASAQDGREHGFQISQRADFFEVEVGLETTLKRPDHQHPRRAARRSREVPPAARHHRRREPLRGLDLPQGRHHLAGAGHDRGPVHHRDLSVGGPGRGAAGGLPRPDAAPPGHAGRRPHADRRPAAAGVPRPGPQVRRGPVRRRRRRADRRRAAAVGVGAGPARARPDAAAPASWTGSAKLQAARAVPPARRAGLGRRQAAADRLPVLRHPPREGPLPPAGRAPAGSSGCSTTPPSRPRCTSRRRTPGPTSAAGAWRSTPTWWPPPPGTR